MLFAKKQDPAVGRGAGQLWMSRFKSWKSPGWNVTKPPLLLTNVGAAREDLLDLVWLFYAIFYHTRHGRLGSFDVALLLVQYSPHQMKVSTRNPSNCLPGRHFWCVQTRHDSFGPRVSAAESFLVCHCFPVRMILRNQLQEPPKWVWCFSASFVSQKGTNHGSAPSARITQCYEGNVE